MWFGPRIGPFGILVADRILRFGPAPDSTYSTYARGEEVLVGTYSFLDLLPKGRDENGPNYNLMDWVKRHDVYEDGNSSDATAQHKPAGQTHECCSATEQRS
jgi:hypothetical protein